MRVIFLDIDGPVIPPKTLMAQRAIDKLQSKLYGAAAQFADAAKDVTWMCDPTNVILITLLAEETNAKIVISSTWRGHGYEGFVEDFKSFGFDPDLLHQDWRTTDKILTCREDEVQAWLDRHPETEAWVTIDDEALDFDNHVQVCAANGFLADNYTQAHELLTGKEAPMLVSLYNQAHVDFYGPQHIIDESPKVQRSIERLRQRRAQTRERFNRLEH